MRVTPINRRFGKYQPGEEFELPDKVARVFINAKKVVEAGLSYQTRAMTADMSPKAEVDANGHVWDAALHVSTRAKNADGTWRKKPGRSAA